MGLLNLVLPKGATKIYQENIYYQIVLTTDVYLTLFRVGLKEGYHFALNLSFIWVLHCIGNDWDVASLQSLEFPILGFALVLPRPALVLCVHNGFGV